jgi:MFS family permease
MKSNNRWFVVAMLWLVCFLNYADRQVIFVVFPLLRREFSLSNAQLGALSASFMVVYALTGPLAGWICDRTSRRRLVVGALVFWSVITALSSLAHTYWQLVAGVALAGLGEAFYFPAAMSLISDHHAADTRSRAMAFHQSGVYVGSIAGGWLAGILGQYLGWRAGFRIFGAAGVALGFLLAALLREPARGLSDADAGPIRADHGLRASLVELARNRGARLLVWVFVGANFVAMVFTVWMPTYLFTRFHMDLSLAGLNGTAYLQIASIVGVVAGGVLADASVQRSTSRGGSGRMRVQAFGLLCGVPFLFLSGWAASASFVLAAMAGFGLCKGVYEASLWASLYDVVPVERRGASVGAMNSLGWLGAAAAQLIVGVASEHVSLGMCLSATAAIYLTSGLMMLHASRTVSRGNEPAPA